MSSTAETQHRLATNLTPKSRSHWTIYPSLLKTLENDSHIIALENAVCAHHCGRYNDGRNIFDTQLPPTSSLPILALERSDMLTTQGLEHERIALLKEALKNEDVWSTKVTGGERELLSLLLADAEYWAYGRMKRLLNKAPSIREWLSIASVAELSDIQVRCVIAYYLIMIECRRHSNWVKNDSDGIIFPALGQDPWTELSTVRRSLRAQGRLLAATRIAKVDKSQRKDLALQSLCEDLIELCDEMEAVEEDSLRYKACTTRLIILGLLKGLGSEEASAQNVLVARENLKCFQSVKYTTWADFSPRVALDLSIKATEEARVQDMDRIIQLQALAEDAWNRKDLTKKRLIFIASVNAAQRWHEKAGTDESRQLYSNLEQDFLSWETTTASLAPLQAYALSRVLTTLRCTTSKWEEIINHYIAFDEQFSDLDIPAIQERLLDTALSAAEQLKDDKLKKKYRKIHNIHWLQCPFSETGEEGADQAKRAYKLSTSAQNDPLYFRRELYHPDPNQMCLRVVRVLLRWAKTETERGLLSLSDGFQTFGFIKLDGEGEQVPIDWKTAGDDQDPSFYERVVNMMYGSPEPASEDEWRPRFQRIEDWLLLEDHPPFPEARHFVLKSLQKARVYKINDYWIKKRTTPDVNGARQIMAEDDRLESILSRITPEARSETDISEIQGNIIKKTLVSASVPNAAAFGLITDEKLQRAYEIARHLAVQHRSQERYKYLTYHSVPASAILLPLEQADAIFRELQREQLVLQGSRSLVAKTAVSSQLMQTTLYDQALAACLGAYLEWSHGNFTSGRGGGSNFINWIQRSKARALNDGLGLQAELPTEIRSAIEQSPASKRLLAKESLMLQELPDLQLQARLKLHKSLDELRIEMRRDPILKPAMDFRDGTTIRHEEIENMLSEIGGDIVIVEYVHIIYIGTMRIILYRAQSTQILDVPDIRMVDVIAWVKDNLDGPPNYKKSSGPLYPLRKTSQKPSDPSQAETLIRPGETITKAIHRVPLHALSCAGIPLIVRNPVVYCQSLSTLRYCYLSSRDSFLPQSLAPKRTFLHLLPLYDHRSGEKTTLATGYVDDLARQLNSEAYVGYGSTKSAILDAITSSSLLHYHGHVDFKPIRPLSSGLIINDNKPESYAPASNIASEPPVAVAAKAKPSLLTATEIFTLRLHRGAHVNLIGCESGLAEINDNDDLHGLVTAFHYAGASSVVSTLWSIDDDDGIMFSKAFFESLVRQHDSKTNAHSTGRGGMQHLLDIARATQEAIMALRGGEGSPRDPYHWAGIVLNGYWNCPSRVLGLEDR